MVLKLTSCTWKPMCHGVQLRMVPPKQDTHFSLLIITNLPDLSNGTRQTVMPLAPDRYQQGKMNRWGHPIGTSSSIIPPSWDT